MSHAGIPEWGLWANVHRAVAFGRARGLAVTDYGAVGDGTTDDTQAFRDAIADLVPGEVLYLPAGGSFYIEAVGVTVPVTMVGYGASVVGDNENLRVAASRVDVFGVRFVGGNVLQDDVDGQESRWTFRDCVFEESTLRIERAGRDDGTGATVTTGTGLASNVKVVDCEFFGYAGNYALQIAGASDVTVRGADIHDTGVDVDQGDGIKILHGATRILVDGCTIDSPTRDCIDTFNGGRVTIRGCTLRNAGAQAVDSKWTAASTVDTGFLIVEGNRAEGCAAGFNVDAPKGRIIGNVCEGSGTYGFRASQSTDTNAATEYVSFVANLADSNTGDGFVFSNGDNLILSANHAVGNGGFGYSKGVAVGVLGDATNNIADGNTSGGFNGFA